MAIINGQQVFTVVRGFNPTPALLAQAVSEDSEFIFTCDLTANQGLGIFTFGNCMTIINLYGLQQNVVYKTAGTFVYNNQGAVTTTTINYVYDGTTLTISSGNSNYQIYDGYTGYLYLVKLN